MKKLLVIGLLVGFSAQAQVAVSTRIISDKIHTLDIDLNKSTVQCLVGDYTVSSLKVVIPFLKYYTQLDHTSEGASGPCVNAGRCNQTFSDTRLPGLTDPTIPKEKINLQVKMLEVFASIDGKTCRHTYREEVSTMIRGIPFSHVQEIELSQVDIQNCK